MGFLKPKSTMSLWDGGNNRAAVILGRNHWLWITQKSFHVWHHGNQLESTVAQLSKFTNHLAHEWYWVDLVPRTRLRNWWLKIVKNALLSTTRIIPPASHKPANCMVNGVSFVAIVQAELNKTKYKQTRGLGHFTRQIFLRLNAKLYGFQGKHFPYLLWLHPWSCNIWPAKTKSKQGFNMQRVQQSIFGGE